MLGHATLFRGILSSVLADIVLERRLSVEEAVEMGKWILRQNAEEIFLK